MVEIIKVAEIAPIAMTEQSGMSIREKIKEILERENEVLLDFEGVYLFATPFFNSSVGYFVINLTPEKADAVIRTTNLTQLGVETYSHSLENAREIFTKKEDIDVIGKITADTIEGR